VSIVRIRRDGSKYGGRIFLQNFDNSVLICRTSNAKKTEKCTGIFSYPQTHNEDLHDSLETDLLHLNWQRMVGIWP